MKIVLDPREQTADAEKANNTWPPQIDEAPFSLKPSNDSFNNEMKKDRSKKAAEAKKKAEEKEKKEAAKKERSLPYGGEALSLSSSPSKV